MQNYNPNNNYRPNQNYRQNNGYNPDSKTVYYRDPGLHKQSQQLQRPQQVPQAQTQESNKNTQLLIILLSICITIIVIVGAILIATSGHSSSVTYTPNDGGNGASDVSTTSPTNSDNGLVVDPGQQTTIPEPTERPNVIDAPDEHDVVESKPYYYQEGVQLPSYIFSYTYTGTITTAYADSKVNMRKGPSKNYGSRKQLKTGTNVTVYGEDYDSNGQVWFYVYHGGKYGWIRGDYLYVY